MMKRRDVLKWGVAGLSMGATLAPTLVAAQQSAGKPTPPTPAAQPAAPPTPKPFDSTIVLETARALAKKPFKPATAALPDVFTNLGYEAYVGIRTKPEGRIWAQDNVGFALEPLHRGFLFSAPVALNIVEDGTPRRLTYRTSDFEFGKLNVEPSLTNIGFSGFRVLRPNDQGQMVEVAVFQGASFFRAVAAGQNLGVMARGLAIRTADSRGEEFPQFKEIWIERPSLGGNTLIIHAVLDSESATAAFRFTLRPGEATIIDTECTLIPRVAIDHYGLAAMQGTFLHGSIDHRQADDVRPIIGDFQGLRMLTGRGEWLWRPVSNRDTLQVSSFLDENPAGFGFIQQNRSFETFQDDDQHWELRPSLWIEPIGDWGQGSVNLVEIPSESEVNQNVVAYWRPKAPLAAGVETAFAYRQFWCWTPPNRPPLATVNLSSSGRVPGSTTAAAQRRRRFLVEFAGDVFVDVKAPDMAVTLMASQGSVLSVRSFVSASRKTCRVMFDFDPAAETLSEMRLVLQAAGKPISETWLYRWTA